MQSEHTKSTKLVKMPIELATNLLLDDCDRMLSEIEYRETMRTAAMLEWLREVYCKGMPELRIVQTHDWALQVAAVGGADLVWVALKSEKAGTLAQK